MLYLLENRSQKTHNMHCNTHWT